MFSESYFTLTIFWSSPPPIVTVLGVIHFNISVEGGDDLMTAEQQICALSHWLW